jgi:GNAT superfamily N-acetyltransferase
MSTSADAQRDRVSLRAVRYDDPVATRLIERVQQEYVLRYGGRDAAGVDPGEFAPPAGLFLVAEVDGAPAGCGGWRLHAPGVAELKRMYVEPEFRRHGIARRVLGALEETAARAGHRHLLLNSGGRQPEALALYARAGYTPVAGYGIYADSPEAVFLGKDLGAVTAAGGQPDDGQERPWAS